MNAPLWSPRDEDVAVAEMSVFARMLGREVVRTVEDYDRLWRWSVEESAAFWSAVWDFARIESSNKGTRLHEEGERIWQTRFFPEARLNFAENCLKPEPDDPIALSSWLEQGEPLRLSRSALIARSIALAIRLRSWGVREGDTVAAVLPNIGETVIAMLGCTALGALWTSASPDFGVEGIVDRIGQVRPKVLIVADGYAYNGKVFDRREVVQALVQRLPTLERVLGVSHLQRVTEGKSFAASSLAGARGKIPLIDFDVATEPHSEAEQFSFPQLPFDHPLCVLYSSGTTGVPKAIIHRAGGVLIKHLCEHRLHCDVRRGDRVFFFTTCGWMMWNWLVSALASSARIILYDGAPLFDQSRVLWRICAAEQATLFGASAKYFATLDSAGFRPREAFDSSALRAVVSTGSPLPPEGFDYMVEALAERSPCPISISGGTDLCGCFVMGCPTLPTWRGEITVRALGMQVEVFSPEGEAIQDRKGELVCRNAFPSMPLGFLNDNEQQTLYRETYFARYENVWHHGDFAKINSNTGGIVILGRSDSTLNVGGVRIGTAEIYRQVERLPFVEEAIAIEQSRTGEEGQGTRIVLFVRLSEGYALDTALRTSIAACLRENCSPRHVPSRIVEVADIPRTRSGKITERAVRDVVNGRPIDNIGALANPQSLEHFRDRSELRD